MLQMCSCIPVLCWLHTHNLCYRHNHRHLSTNCFNSLSTSSSARVILSTSTFPNHLDSLQCFAIWLMFVAIPLIWRIRFLLSSAWVTSSPMDATQKIFFLSCLHCTKNTPKFPPESALSFPLFNRPNQLTFVSFYIVTTTCTVDLLTPKAFAVSRTVAPRSMI